MQTLETSPVGASVMGTTANLQIFPHRNRASRGRAATTPPPHSKDLTYMVQGHVERMLRVLSESEMASPETLELAHQAHVAFSALLGSLQSRARA
ncbi:hypothetical protein [Celeribacter sp.]|uniref:hypothetical protein n=1 Tax=Celeribacter sp. TaxID=1890673 RepID=UPI003A93C735